MSAVGGDADPVTLGVGQDPEAGARHFLFWLDDAAPQAPGLLECLPHVLNGDKEQHLVLYAPFSAPVSMKV
jgi:hypothetical protein